MRETNTVQSLLRHPLAWDILSDTEKAEVLSLFPDKEHIQDANTPDARPNFMSLMNDDTFRHDCAAYTDNLRQGKFDPEWLACAWSASELRKTGEFDQHLVEKFESDWGIELSEEFKPRRREDGGQNDGCQNGHAQGQASRESTPILSKPSPSLREVKVQFDDEHRLEENTPEDGEPMDLDKLQFNNNHTMKQNLSLRRNHSPTRTDSGATGSDDEVA